jgi:hypothetical protein
MGIAVAFWPKSRANRVDDRELPNGSVMASDAKLLLYSKGLATGWLCWRMVMTNVQFAHSSKMQAEPITRTFLDPGFRLRLRIFEYFKNFINTKSAENKLPITSRR